MSSNGAVARVNGRGCAFARAQDGHLSSFGGSPGTSFSTVLVTALFAISTIVFMLRCPILRWQSYTLIASNISPMLNADSGCSSSCSRRSCSFSSDTSLSTSPATKPKSEYIVRRVSGYTPFFIAVHAIKRLLVSKSVNPLRLSRVPNPRRKPFQPK